MSALKATKVGLHYKRSCKNGTAYMHLDFGGHRKYPRSNVGRFVYIANDGRAWAHKTEKFMLTVHPSRPAVKYNPDARELFIDWSDLIDKSCELNDFSGFDGATWFVPRKNRRAYQKSLAVKTFEELPTEEEWLGLLERNIITNDCRVPEENHFGGPFVDDEQNVIKENLMADTTVNTDAEQDNNVSKIYVVMATKNGTTTPVMAFSKKGSADELVDSLSVANEVMGTKVCYSVRDVRYKP